jgi:hypothetical protein
MKTIMRYRRPEGARKTAQASFDLIKPSQSATLKITKEGVDTVRVKLILSIIGLAG